jgi:hypothetical protein
MITMSPAASMSAALLKLPRRPIAACVSAMALQCQSVKPLA